MDTIDPYKATEEASQHMEARRDRAEQAFSWFENQDGLVYRQDAVEAITEHFDWTEDQANVAIGDLLSDTPDPVQQVTHPDGKYVGIIDYDTSPDSGCYGFVEYDDRGHKAKRVVCARCVEIEEDHESVITVSEDIDTDWEDMESRIVKHIVEAHDVAPEDVNPAASLASPTTIGGNEAFHKGNDGSGSGLNADKLDGSDKSQIGDVTLPVRGANGNINTQTSYTFASPTYGLTIRSNDFMSLGRWWSGGTALRTVMETETAGDFTFSASIRATQPTTTASIEFFMEKAGVRFFTHKTTVTPNGTKTTNTSITATGVGLNETLRGGISATVTFKYAVLDGPYNIYQGRFKRTPTGTGSSYTGFFGVSANFRSPTYVNYSVGGKTTGGSSISGLPSTTLTTGSISYFSVSWTITDVTNYGPLKGRFTNNVVNLVPQTATYS